MSGRDGTGPLGKGPMSGGGHGRCMRAGRRDQVAMEQETKPESEMVLEILGIGKGGRPHGGGRGRCLGGGQRQRLGAR